MTTHGTFTFDTAAGADADRYLYTDPVATDATLPQAAGTVRRWCHEVDETASTGVGPQSGAGGDPDGYLYNETSSPGAFDDIYLLTFDTALDASAEQWQFNFKTNQRGDDNDVVCQVQINESSGGWVDVGAAFGGSGDPDKVGTSGTDIWSSRSVDLSASGVNVDSSTQVRIELTCPAAGTTWHNDYGIDEIQIVGSVLWEQEGYRWRNDNGSESAATWKQNQDKEDIMTKTTNTRLRVLNDSAANDATKTVTLQYRRVGDPDSEWRSI